MKHTKNQDMNKDLSANLKRYRARRKLSCRALGAAAGVSGVYVWQVEAGVRHPTLVTIGKLAAALEVKVGDLLKPAKVPAK